MSKVGWVTLTGGPSQKLACDTNEFHKLLLLNSAGPILAVCLECDRSEPLTVGSTFWYDNHENLWLLLDWLGDGADAKHVVEKPWKWADEYLTAQAVRDHENTTQHTVYKDGLSEDTSAYCDQCPWAWTDGQQFDRDPEPVDMSGPSRHAGADR